MKPRLRDGRGKPVPARLAEPFRNRDVLLRHVSRLQDWENNLVKRKNKPGGEQIDLNEIHTHIHAILYHLTNHIPNEMCDAECDPKEWLSLAEVSARGRSVLPEE